MKISYLSKAFSIGALVFLPLSTMAGGMPPANAKPLSGILSAVQTQGIGNVAEAEFDHGKWEVTVCTHDTCQELKINPITGAEEKRSSADFERPAAANAGSIVEIVQRIEAANVGVVTGVDLDRGQWKVELAIVAK